MYAVSIAGWQGLVQVLCSGECLQDLRNSIKD